MFNLLTPTIIEHLASRIAGALRPSIQAKLGAAMSSVRSAGSSGKGFGRTLGETFSGYFSGPSGRGGTSGAGGSSPARSRRPPSGWNIGNRIADWWGSRQAQMNSRGGGDPSWWQRGWGNQSGSSQSGSGSSNGNPSFLQRMLSRFTGRKKSAITRAARLKVLTQKRFAAADRAVKASNKNRGSSTFSDAAHGQLLAKRRAAAQKLAQATGLQARATSLGALASGRVAGGLMSLASKIPMLARFAGPVGVGASIGVALAKLPFTISRMNENRLQSQREGANYSGQLANAFAKLDLQKELNKANTARETAGSTSWLADEQRNLSKTLQPIQSKLTDAWNNLQAFGTSVLNEELKRGQEKINWAGAVIAEAEEAWKNGRLPTWGGLKDKKEGADKIREEAEKAREKFHETAFGNVTGAWATTIDHKKEARQNNRPKQPIKPIK